MLKDIKLKTYIVWKTFSVPSKSHTDEYHKVVVMKDGETHCDCEARKECWHIQQVKLELSGFVSVNKYSI